MNKQTNKECREENNKFKKKIYFTTNITTSILNRNKNREKHSFLNKPKNKNTDIKNMMMMKTK